MNAKHDYRDFYIDGRWVAPAVAKDLPVIDPSTEQAFATISLGSAADVDKAATAARRAFEGFARTTPDERLALLESLRDAYLRRSADLGDAISMEMGAPRNLPAARRQNPVWPTSTPLLAS